MANIRYKKTVGSKKDELATENEKIDVKDGY